MKPTNRIEYCVLDYRLLCAKFTTMKNVVLLMFIFLSFNSYSQMNEVSGGNIGLSFFGGGKLNSSSTSSSYSAGLMWGVGITTAIRNIIFPEVSYGSSKTMYGADTLGNALENNSNELGMGINSKIPIYNLSLGKSSKGECWYLNIKFLLDYKYSVNFKNKTNFTYTSQNDHLLNLGIGINPKYSGGHKSRVAWSYFYDVGYRLDLNKNDGFSIDDQTDWKQNGFFFRLTIVHHKTSDFLGGNKPKKSYKC